MKNIAQAILKVMEDVKGIDKTMTIGTGSSSYKGVPDQEVKKVIGESMKKNGLTILPISVEPTLKIDRWEEIDQYSKETPKATKTKQSIFTEVKTKYLLLHESGESIELAGYGHGVDTQDKGAGKATTYALKYTLLYTFLVPTGKIDDADVTHSETYETPKVNQQPNQQPAKDKWLNKYSDKAKTKVTEEWNKTVSWLLDVEDLTQFDKKIETIKTTYSINKENLAELISMRP
jgi:hypothetical protein